MHTNMLVRTAPLKPLDLKLTVNTIQTICTCTITSPSISAASVAADMAMAVSTRVHKNDSTSPSLAITTTTVPSLRAGEPPWNNRKCELSMFSQVRMVNPTPEPGGNNAWHAPSQQVRYEYQCQETLCVVMISLQAGVGAHL